MARRAACPTRHVQLPGRRPGGPPEPTRGWRRAALGAPLAEIPQRLGHLRQPIATVDDRHDPSGLAEPNHRPRRSAPDRTARSRSLLPLALPATAPSAAPATASPPIRQQTNSVPHHQRALPGEGRTMGGEIENQVVAAPIAGDVGPHVVEDASTGTLASPGCPARARLQCHSSHSSTIAAMVTLILGGCRSVSRSPPTALRDEHP